MFSLILTLTFLANSSWAEKIKPYLKVCVPIEKINFYPFRKINDPKEMAYLTTLRSYISTEPSEPGLLQAYEFSPDGKTFTGRINSDLKWLDGTPFTSTEAADGIVNAISHRLLGDRVSVAKSEAIDEKTFKIIFQSKIENLTGVLREALSTNSRHNRFWPIKAGSTPDRLEVLAKFPMVKREQNVGLNIFGHEVFFVAQGNCEDPDMTVFKETITQPMQKYRIKRSTVPSLIVLQTNTPKLSKSERSNIIQLVKAAFAESEPELGMVVQNSFFAEGEFGFDSQRKWPGHFDKSMFKGRTLKIAYNVPLLKEVLKKFASKNGLKVELIAPPIKNFDADAIIFASTIQAGRHVFLQDIIAFPHIKKSLGAAPKTESTLNEIARRSASTLPPDTELLKSAESAAIEESSMAPIARRHIVAFSKLNSPVCLNWSPQGEVTFSNREKCLND